MSTEAQARILIDDLLRQAGWRFFDDDTGPANVALEAHVRVTKRALDPLGEDFEKTAHGFADYLLLDAAGHPAAVLEASPKGTIARGGGCAVHTSWVWPETGCRSLTDFVGARTPPAGRPDGTRLAALAGMG